MYPHKQLGNPKSVIVSTECFRIISVVDSFLNVNKSLKHATHCNGLVLMLVVDLVLGMHKLTA